MKTPALLACLHPPRTESGSHSAVPTFVPGGNGPARYAREMERHVGGDMARLCEHLAQLPADQQRAVIDGSAALRDFLGIRNPNGLQKKILSFGASSPRIPDTDAPIVLALAATRSGNDARAMRALTRLEEVLTTHPPGHGADHAHQQRVETALRDLLHGLHALHMPAAQHKALDLVERHLLQLDPGARQDIISVARNARGRQGVGSEINTRLQKLVDSEGGRRTLGELLNIGEPEPAGRTDNRGKAGFAAILKHSGLDRPDALARKPADQAGTSSDGAATLSKNKTRFLKEDSRLLQQKKARSASVQLSNAEIARLAKAYSQQIGSPIHFSGDVIPITAEHRKAWRAEQEKALDDLLSHPDSGVRMLHRYFPQMCRHKALVQDFPLFPLMDQQQLAPDALNASTKAALADIINANKYGIGDKLRDCVRKERKELAKTCEQIGHGPGRGKEELAAIASNTGGVAHGYLFPTADKASASLGMRAIPERGHIESYAVSSTGAVINVIPYTMSRSNRPNLEGQYSADMTPFLFNTSRWVLPQAGTVECGTMGLSYLKQYLKDDARQLNENTLLVDVKTHEGPLHFHLPSPQVLEYSQSNLYAKVVRAFVAGEQDFVTVEHDGKEIEVRTLQGCLNKGGAVRRPDGKEIPGGIEAFRTTWLELCDASDAKRLQMRSEDRNLYATYASQRLHKKAQNLPH